MSDLRVLELPSSHGGAALAAGVTLQEISRADREALAEMYLVAYPPEIGAADLGDPHRECIDLGYGLAGSVCH
ncbi:hypothetical protein [Gryllotalpicola koreensis]|uniref:GNAT family N-acetyltransferase n=1 Tax=Gryllotalpicola koreensis TaxID=993086 RepID=A0ABP7ZV95_9MICO